jgi:hypothetical protein
MDEEMKLWIVKLGEIQISRPLPIAEAAAYADQVVEAQDSFCEVTIEFYAQEL